jgi:phosphotransacetylase
MLSTLPFEVPGALLDKARNLAPVPMAVVGANHPLVMESARRAADEGIIEPVLVGVVDDVQAIARDMGWDIGDLRCIDTTSEAKAAEASAALAKGHEVAALMKGNVHTDDLMRAVLRRDGGLRMDRRVSHVFHMTAPGSDRVLHITDAVVNVQPDADDMVDIVTNAIDLAHALGMAEPKVALLSGTEVPNAGMPSSQVAATVAIRLSSAKALVDGPFGFDNAISPEAAALKGIDSPVAGHADILVVPNIESGNILFKQMVYFMSATAAGLVVGVRVPIVLTSRADPPEARLAAAAMAAIAAAANAAG